MNAGGSHYALQFRAETEWRTYATSDSLNLLLLALEKPLRPAPIRPIARRILDQTLDTVVAMDTSALVAKVTTESFGTVVIGKPGTETA